MTALRLNAQRWGRGALVQISRALEEGIICPLLSDVELWLEECQVCYKLGDPQSVYAHEDPHFAWRDDIEERQEMPASESDRELCHVASALASDLRKGYFPLHRFVLKVWELEDCHSDVLTLLCSHACIELETLELHVGHRRGVNRMLRQVFDWLNTCQIVSSLKALRLSGLHGFWGGVSGYYDDWITLLSQGRYLMPNLEVLSLANLPLSMTSFSRLCGVIEKGAFYSLNTLELENVSNAGEEDGVKLPMLMNAFENNKKAIASLTTLNLSRNEERREVIGFPVDDDYRREGLEAVMRAFQRGLFPSLRRLTMRGYRQIDISSLKECVNSCLGGEEGRVHNLEIET